MRCPPGTERISIRGEGDVLAVKGLGSEWVTTVLRSHRENRDPARILKRNLGTLVSRAHAPMPAGAASLELPDEVVVKEVPLKRRPWIDWLFGPSVSHFCRDYGVYRRLAEKGVTSPRPLACTLRSQGPTEFLISELVASATPLRDLLWLGDRVIQDAAQRAMLFERIGTWLQGLHEAGVWQRDMKPSNLLVRGADFVLVDISAVRFFRRPLDDRRRLRNLAQILDLTPDIDGPSRLPLLKTYLGSEAQIAEWARRIDKAIEARRDYRQSRCGFRYVDEEHFRRARP